MIVSIDNLNIIHHLSERNIFETLSSLSLNLPMNQLSSQYIQDITKIIDNIIRIQQIHDLTDEYFQ